MSDTKTPQTEAKPTESRPDPLNAEERKKYEAMEIAEITAEIEGIEQKRISLKDKGRELMLIRNRKLQEDNAAEHGLTLEQYNAVKSMAESKELPLAQCLKEAKKSILKKGREVQSVKAGSVTVGAKVKGT